MLIADVESPWNSLEVIKLLVGVLSPAVLVLFGFWINRRLKRLEHIQWANQKVIEKRLAVFEECAPLLNDLLCYFNYIGLWKDLDPPQVVALKRQLDKIAFVNAPLFPAAFLHRYKAFISKCYSTYTGWGEDAKLRTLSARRKQAAGNSWQEDWDACFVPEKDATDPEEVRKAYREFMAYFSQELGIGIQSEFVAVGHAPGNIR